MRLVIGVVGPGSTATPAHCVAAEAAGHEVARQGHALVTGGGAGVMAAAARGAAAADGLVVGLLPGSDPAAGNRHLTVALPTGLGELRNALVVRVSDAIVAVGGSWGTLSEIALAMRTGVPVVMIDGWSLPSGPELFDEAGPAVTRVLDLARARRQRGAG